MRTMARESRAALSSKDGFSVVAPTSVIVAVFHVRQEAILLRAVEAMDLVDEQQRAAALLTLHARFVEGFAQVLDAGEDRGQLFEYEVGFAGEQARDRGLAAARRTPEDEARQSPTFEQSRQFAVGPDEMVLAGDFRERPRAQPVGKRARRALLKTGGFEEIGHQGVIGRRIEAAKPVDQRLINLAPAGASLCRRGGYRRSRYAGAC